MASILLVDDSQEIRDVVAAVLKKDHTVDWTPTVADAQAKLSSGQNYDLVLLDIDLPDGSGIDFLSTVASEIEARGISVIFLTGTDSVTTRTRGYQLGALDYIAKPFDIVEFQVRVNAKLKKVAPRSAVQNVLRKGNIQIDLVRQQAFEVGAELEKQLELTPVEFRLLLLFLQNDGEVVTRQKILDTVWGQNTHVSSRCVDHHVCGLRKKISTSGQKIESIYGVGYRIDVY